MKRQITDPTGTNLMAGICNCKKKSHNPKFIVVTGGPGAGKTAVLETARRLFCEHVAVLNEAASIIFSGGFPRKSSKVGKEAAQRAIFHVQREQELLASKEGEAAVVLCDRGTVDGLAYWPDTFEKFERGLGIKLETEIQRYSAVIHLRSPGKRNGYNRQNPVRIETAEEARRIDRKILGVWEKHPRRYIIESTEDFIEKTAKAMRVILAEVPPCCRKDLPPELFGFE